MTDSVQKTFDPTRHLRKLGKADYLEVKWRLVWLRTEHPDAVIETERVTLDLDRAFAEFRARVSIPGGGSATGWGSETAKDFGDYIEKAETKALGRALAALGFGTQFTEDFDFDPTGQRVVDAPVERQAAPGRTAAVRSAGPATPPAQAPGTITGEKGPNGANVMELAGVRFVLEAISRDGRSIQGYRTLDLCPVHDKPFYAQLGEGNQLSEWAHAYTKDGKRETCFRSRL